MAIDSAIERRLALNSIVRQRLLPDPTASGSDIVEQRASRAKRFVTTAAAAANPAAGNLVTPLLISPLVVSRYI